MPYGAHLEVHFYDEESAAVNVELDASADSYDEEAPAGGDADPKTGELLLFTAFAIRQCANLGPGSLSGSIGTLLSQMSGGLRALAHHDGRSGPKLIEFPGFNAKRRFIAALQGQDEHYSFVHHAKGFGILAKGMGFYAPNSIFLVIRRLCLGRYDDDDYVRSLERAATLCGRAILAGEISVLSQHPLALQIARQANRRAEGGKQRPKSRRPKATVQVTTADLADFFEEEAALIQFSELDPATREAFDRCVRGQAAVIMANCPEVARSITPDFLQDVGKGVLDGYVVGRRLLGTHRARILFSANGAEARLLSRRLSEEQGKVEPGRILQAAGGPAERYLTALVEVYSAQGIHGEISDRGAAKSLLFLAMINGLALAYAENSLAKP